MIDQFIQRLTSNPNFMGQPASTIETHICNFIQQNKHNLAPVLTQQLYPRMDLDGASHQLTQRVQAMTAEQILEQSSRLIHGIFDPGILAQSGVPLEMSGQELEGKILTYFKKIISHRDARVKIDGVNIILSEAMINNYVNTAYDGKGSLFTELHRVDTRHLQGPAMIEYLKLVAVVTPGFGVTTQMPGMNMPVSAIDLRNDSNRLNQYFNKVIGQLRSDLPFLNEMVWKSAMGVFADISELPGPEPASRLLAIFFQRARDYRKTFKIEKGAETPDKSWFSVHMRNAQFLGLDKKMLEDLNRIAFDLRK